MGLGRGFLRHIERCKIIVHIVNGDSEDPLRDFSAINNELQLFSPLLASKPQVVVLNKIDIPSVAARKDEIMAGLLKLMPHTRLLWWDILLVLSLILVVLSIIFIHIIIFIFDIFVSNV